MFDPTEYPRQTHREREAEFRADEERAWVREHECHAQIGGGEACGDLDETKPCDGCGDHFCPVHLYDGMCRACFAIDCAAEEMEVAERLAA